MNAKYFAAFAVALALNGCAWEEKTQETIVQKQITPGPGSTTQPSTTVTDTIVKESGPKGKAPTSVGTTVMTTTTAAGGTSSSTTSDVKGSIITPSSTAVPIIQPEMPANR